jgi:hypothetical protein
MRVDKRIEAKARAPRIGKVGNVHMLVAVRFALAPQQQGIFG